MLKKWIALNSLKGYADIWSQCIFGLLRKAILPQIRLVLLGSEEVSLLSRWTKFGCSSEFATWWVKNIREFGNIFDIDANV